MSDDINKSKRFLADIEEYTDQTTIHGLKYLGAKGLSIVEKCFWLLILSMSFLILGYYLQQVIQKWQDRNVILVEDIVPTNIYEIPFPAVTVCPQFKIKSEYFSYENTSYLVRSNRRRQLLNDTDALRQYEIGAQICDRDEAQLLRLQYKEYLQFRHLTKEHIDLLLEMGPDIKRVLGPSRYQEDAYRFENNIMSVASPGYVKLFSKIITNEGLCFTFNLPSEILRTENLQTDYRYYNINDKIKGWDYEHGYSEYPSFPRRTYSVGSPYSLSSRLFARIKDLNNLCVPTNLGYKILVHSPSVYPNLFSDFIPLQHNTNFQIKLKPKITTTSPDLRSFTPKQRQCYFNDERKLQFFRFYNKANCKLECFGNYSIAKYGCVHFSMPRTNTTPICGFDIDFHKAYADCDNLQSLNSFATALPSSASLEKELSGTPNISCDCLPECNLIDYGYSIDTYNMPNIQKNKLLVQHALTQFQVYFEENLITGKTRKQLYTVVDMISSFGGLVGLFIGASILSIFELLYFCVIRQINKLKIP